MGRRAEQVEDYARRHGIGRWYTDAQALIDDPEVQAVYVATPPDSHHTYALQVAAAGKHCCVEKPMALDATQSREMVQAFERAGTQLFVAYYRRSLPRFLRVRQWLDAGQIGEVRQLSWHLSKAPSANDRQGPGWRTDPRVAGGGYFADLASHGLDLFQFLLGDIVEVEGMKAQQAGLYPAEDAVVAIWRFASGALGLGSWNFAVDRRIDQVEILGSEGRIRFSVFDEAPIELQGRSSAHETIAHPSPIQWHHVLAMNAQLRGERPHPAAGHEALKTDWVMDRILARQHR